MNTIAGCFLGILIAVLALKTDLTPWKITSRTEAAGLPANASQPAAAVVESPAVEPRAIPAAAPAPVIRHRGDWMWAGSRNALDRADGPVTLGTAQLQLSAPHPEQGTRKSGSGPLSSETDPLGLQ